MSLGLENANRPAPRARWVMLGVAALSTWSCGGSTDTGPVSGGLVAAVVVTPSSSTLAVGSQLPLQAQVQDAAGKLLPDAPVVWSVKDSAIANVSANGVVTARAVGSTQVAANSNGKSGIAAITVQKTPVASVTVRPSHVDANAGSTAQLTGIAYDAAQNPLADRAIIWTSSNTSVATVSSTGLMTAHAAGSATITGTSEGKSDAATVTVVQGPVASVVVTPDTVSMTVSQTTQLSATARDGAGGIILGTTIVWASSNTGVASVSSTGVVTAVSAGTATITATSNGHSGTAAITVTAVPVATVAVSPQSVTLAPGAVTTLTATTKDANGNILPNRAVTWVSSNNSVATVSATGDVTAVALGTATITATSEGKTGTASVTVAPAAVGSVTVSPATASVIVGQTTNLTATVKDANGAVLTGRTVTWTSSNTAIATVSATGVVTGVAVGSATITATSEGKSGTAAVTVVPVPVGSVTVSPATANVTQGLTTQLTATVKDVNGVVLTDRVVTWTSSDATKATVSSTGLVTGVAAGTVTITATSEGKSGTAAVTVLEVPVGSVTVSPASSTIYIGHTTTLTATVKDQNGTVVTDRVVTWTSSDATKATVSSTGLVTGVAAGVVTITATSEGKSGSATVTVLAPVASVTVTPTTVSVASGSTTQFTATLKDASGNILTGRTVTWASSDITVATVSASGLATALLVGSATITAASEGVTSTVGGAMTVTPGPVATVAVTPSSATIAVNGTVQLTAKALDAQGNTVTGAVFTWQTSNGQVATVSSSGLVTGKKSGTATISAITSAKTGTSSITVSP
ncbi:MAG TPA: Ig-like domain-containing protein [Gemmatimonadaceae bacterium]